MYDVTMSEIHQISQSYVIASCLFGRNHLQKFDRSVMILIFKIVFPKLLTVEGLRTRIN